MPIVVVEHVEVSAMKWYYLDSSLHWFLSPVQSLKRLFVMRSDPFAILTPVSMHSAKNMLVGF